MNKIVVITVAICALLGAPVWAASLKVTSFPDGALVSIDGVSTGKYTPAQMSVVEGTHVVQVAIAGSGWDPVTTTVLISTGSNDLSVTLLPHVMQGPPGQSVTSASLLPGDANCPYGGSRFTSASGDTYVCNGATGATGATGGTGAQGPPGSSLPDCPSSSNAGLTCAAAENLGTIAWGGALLRTGKLPAGGSGDHWYAVTWSASGTDYHPHAYLSFGAAEYVFDVYYDCQGFRLCSIPPETAYESFNWEISSTAPIQFQCLAPGTAAYIRVRPIGLNLMCDSYTLVIQNG